MKKDHILKIEDKFEKIEITDVKDDNDLNSSLIDKINIEKTMDNRSFN